MHRPTLWGLSELILLRLPTPRRENPHANHGGYVALESEAPFRQYPNGPLGGSRATVCVCTSQEERAAIVQRLTDGDRAQVAAESTYNAEVARRATLTAEQRWAEDVARGTHNHLPLEEACTAACPLYVQPPTPAELAKRRDHARTSFLATAVRADCGHTVAPGLLMNASLGTSCADCYDRLSG